MTTARMIVAIFASIVCLLFVIASVNGDQSITISTYLTGGQPSCAQCGVSGQYACSDGKIGKWKSKYSFIDPVPQGSVVTQIVVKYVGSYGCNGTTAVIQTVFNNWVIGVANQQSSLCKCNTCDGYISVPTGIFQYGITNYNYGGSNAVYLNVQKDTICLNVVNITISYTPYPAGVIPGYTSTHNHWLASTSTGTSPICDNTRGSSSAPSTVFSFTDPLPSKSILVGVNVLVYGLWCCGAGCQGCTVVISSSLLNTAISSSTQSCSYYHSCLAYQCDPLISLTSNVYQNGWPSYSYGGKNQITVTSSRSNSNNLYQPMIASISVQLYYYPFQSATCEVSDSARKECGFAGVTEDECDARDCCWDPILPNPQNLPWCYFPINTKLNTTTTTTTTTASITEARPEPLVMTVPIRLN